MEEKSDFIPPHVRLLIDLNKQTGKLRLKRKQQLSMVAENDKFDQEVQAINLEFSANANVEKESYESNLKKLRQTTSIIGSGCECGQPIRNAELEDALVDYLPLSVSQLTIAYLPTKTTPRILLSDQQKSILRLVFSGQNVFFTGCAG
jgi:hypothetical protein